jgi:hypothetical protein
MPKAGWLNGPLRANWISSVPAVVVLQVLAESQLSMY